MSRVAHIALAVLLMVVAACGDIDGTPPEFDFDGGVTMGTPDGGGARGDAGLPPDLSANSSGVRARDDSAEFDMGTGGTGSTPLRECLGEPACMSDGCETVRSCCVGSGLCCAAAPALSVVLTPSDCGAGTLAETCFAGVEGFGSPASSIRDGGLVPGGDGFGDSGLLVGDPIDLGAHRLDLSATFEPPVGCEGECIESIGIGVTTQGDVAGTVAPLAGLVYSGSRGRVSLVLGDIVVTHWDVSDTSSETWTLSLAPNGEVVVEGPSTTAGATWRFSPPTSARAVLWGRSVNPSADATPTRVSSVTATASLCDIPTVWRSRGGLDVTLADGTALSGTDMARAPSILDDGGETLLAFELDGAIRFAREGSPGRFAEPPGAVTVEPNDVEGAAIGRLTDPELVADGAGGYALFATGLFDGGAAQVVRFDVSADLTSVTGGRIAFDLTAADAENIVDLREPTVHVHAMSGSWVLAARARNQEGMEWVQIFLLGDGGSGLPAKHESAALASLTFRAGGMGASFDAETVGHPSLTVHNGAWHLYYAGRNGPQWSLGLLVSDDLVYWRQVPPMRPILTPGARAEESVALRAPDVIRRGDTVEIVYEAGDGARTTLAGAARDATDLGVFP